jgi:tetratricopeptide (TPR) repeat protein
VTELFSVKDVARIFGLQESRLRYWIQTGFISPSVRRGGRLFYTFQDLISVKTATELLEAGLSIQRVRKNLEALRAELPNVSHPLSRLRICSDGDSVVAVDDDVVYEPESGQVVMAFAVATLSNRVAEVLSLPKPEPATPVPRAPVEDDPTIACERPTAYGFFLDGCESEDVGNSKMAEECYRRAIDLEPSIAAAHTNLGNIYYERGDLDAARSAFEQALELEPSQPEARYNLGNLLEDLGETELAIAELRRVCTMSPSFADAHYNLGVLLAKVGGVAQAQEHIKRYLELDTTSEWATRSREFLAAL